MHLLVLTNNPDTASFRYRIGVYLDLLRRQGIDSEVARLPGSLLERRALFASAQHADAVLLQRKVLTAWDGFWLRRYARRVIYDFDDAVMYADRKGGRGSRIRFHRFGRSVALSDLVIAGNGYLAEHAQQYNTNVRVLPTGLDLGPYRESAPRKDDGTVRLVWIGSHSTLRYLQEIGPVLDTLASRFPHVVLRIICDAFFDLEVMKVEKRLWSEPTAAADLASSDIGLAPLPDNPFTRGKCGFKILQYQAAGLPVVASPVGVNAQYVRDGGTGFLARDAAQWLDRLSTVVENRELRRALGCAGQRAVESFDVAVIGASFCRLIEESL